MPIGYNQAPRVSHGNQASRIRRLSRSLLGGANGGPFRITLLSTEEFNLEASPNAANTNSRRPVLGIFSSEFKTGDVVVNSVVVAGYKNDCGFVELRCAADNSRIWGVDNTFVTLQYGILFMDNAGLMLTSSAFIFNNSINKLTIVDDSTKTTPFIQLEQDGTGDTFVNFLLTSTAGFSVGIDNSDGDKLKITTGNTMGDTESVGISTIGQIDLKTYGTTITEVNVNTTLTEAHSTVLVNCDSADRIITPTGITKRVYIIKKIDASANTVTIAATIDGVANPTLTSQYEKKVIQYDGTTWWDIT